MLVVLAAALWGTSGVATKSIYTLVDISPITVAAFRLALGAPLLLVAFRLTSGQRVSGRGATTSPGCCWPAPRSGMSQACYFAAISRVGVAIATLVTICTAPVLVCLFSAALLRERLTRAVVGSLACALIGTVLLIGVGRNDSGLQASAALGGIALALAAAFGFAGFILVSRLLANRYHPLLSITIAVGIGAVLLLAVSAITTGITVSIPPAGLGAVPLSRFGADGVGLCAVLHGSAAHDGFGGERCQPGRAFDGDRAGFDHLRRAPRRAGAARRRAADRRDRVFVSEWFVPSRVSFAQGFEAAETDDVPAGARSVRHKADGLHRRVGDRADGSGRDDGSL